MDRMTYLIAIIDAVASCEATQFVIAVEGALKAGATHEELGKATAIGLRLAELPGAVPPKASPESPRIPQTPLLRPAEPRTGEPAPTPAK